MRKYTLIALALGMTVPAFGQVLVNQTTGQTPNGYFSDGITTNGSQFYQQSVADDFTLATESTVTAIVFWGSSENFVFDDLSNFTSWDISIMDSAFSTVFSTNVLKANLNPTATGQLNINGGIEYQLTFNTNLNLLAGNYYLHVGSINTAPGDDGFVWSTALGNTNVAFNNHDGLGWGPIAQEPGVAFRLEGQPVPEPASMVALGLGALAMIRRRKSA